MFVKQCQKTFGVKEENFPRKMTKNIKWHTLKIAIKQNSPALRKIIFGLFNVKMQFLVIFNATEIAFSRLTVKCLNRGQKFIFTLAIKSVLV